VSHGAGGGGGGQTPVSRSRKVAGQAPRRMPVGWSGDSRGWRGVAHWFRAVRDGVGRVEGGSVSGRRSTGCGGLCGHRGALGLGDVRGWVVRVGGWPEENGTGGCLR
jgi:hypothetical protein